MTNASLSPRPTRSTLRNRRIILDLRASINGSYVGEEGLHGHARRSELPREEKTTSLALGITAIAVVTFLVSLLVAL